MRKYKGSALLDYVLPLALVGIVVGLGIYYGSSNGLLGNFIASSTGQKSDTSSGKIVVGEKPADPSTLLSNVSNAGSKGTPDAPTVNCSNGSCIINYGSFVLEGIPADFNEFVQTNGTSGATDKLSSILEQIALQLNNDGYDSDIVNTIMKLANNGHTMASIEKTFEQEFKNCGTDAQCIYDLMYTTPRTPNVPLTATTELRDVLYHGLTVGGAFADYTEDPVAFQEKLAEGRNTHQFVDNLQKILAEDSLPGEVKGVIRELCWEIGIMGEEFQNNVVIATGYNGNETYDPITGENLVYKAPENADFIQFFHDYKASTITNVNSALICAAGYKDDTGIICH